MNDLPADGQQIRGRRKVYRQLIAHHEDYAGRVSFVFLAADQPCIRLEDGSSVFPTLGDTWEPNESA